MYLEISPSGGRWWRLKYRVDGREKRLALGVYPGRVPRPRPPAATRPAAELEAPDFLSVARRIERRGAFESAHRIMQNCGQVMRYAIATGRATRNPVADLRGALTPAPEQHHAAITDPRELGPLLAAIQGYSDSIVT